MNTQAQSYFQSQFLEDIKKVGEDVFLKYSPIIQMYSKVVIPFETKRLKENQSLIFQNSTLERDKIELLGKIEKFKAENERLEYSLEKQLQKINDIERVKEDLERINLDNSSVIESLRVSNKDYEQVLEKRDRDLQQVQKDKDLILEKFQAKSGDYNILLANYMKDKNLLAEKLNQMNDLEQSLLEKDKELKAEKFYLQKQWEQLEDAQKKGKLETPKPDERKPSRIFGKVIQAKQQQTKVVEKDVNIQILRSPLKKIIKYHQSQIYQLSLNYNGNLLASCGGDRLIKLFDIPNLRPGPTITSNSAENIYISIALNYGGEKLLAGSTDKTVSIFNSQTGKQLHCFPGHGDRVNSVAWASTKEKCITGSQDKQLKIWDIEKTSNILSIGCGKSVKVVRSNSVQPVVYSGHADGSLRVYSITQGNSPVSQVKGLIDYPISSITLMSNRHQVLVTSLEGSSAQIIDLKMNKCLSKYEHKDFFNSATHGCLSPSQGLVLAGNCDGNIYYWNRFKNTFLRKVSGHDGAVTAINYSFMSSLLVSADKEGSLILWQ